MLDSSVMTWVRPASLCSSAMGLPDLQGSRDLMHERTGGSLRTGSLGSKILGMGEERKREATRGKSGPRRHIHSIPYSMHFLDRAEYVVRVERRDRFVLVFPHPHAVSAVCTLPGSESPFFRRNRYLNINWDQETRGSNPRAPTKKGNSEVRERRV